MIRLLIKIGACPALAIITMFACPALGQPHQKATQENLYKMNWLLGSWSRTNTKPGQTANESWVKKSDQEWNGVGVSITGKDTTFIEKLKIVIEKGRLYYVADVPENKKAIYFEMTKVTGNGFICENPTHDFPKKIEYELSGDSLRVHISAGDQVLEFQFTRRP